VRLTLRGALETCFYMEGKRMSQSENIFDPARLVLNQPICQKCGARMWITLIEPDSPNHDRRTFECPRCENVLTETIKYR
jgi:hypothetical protein